MFLFSTSTVFYCSFWIILFNVSNRLNSFFLLTFIFCMIPIISVTILAYIAPVLFVHLYWLYSILMLVMFLRFIAEFNYLFNYYSIAILNFLIFYLLWILLFNYELLKHFFMSNKWLPHLSSNFLIWVFTSIINYCIYVILILFVGFYFANLFASSMQNLS